MICIAATGIVGGVLALGASVVLAWGAIAIVLTPATAALTTGVERAGEDSSLGFALMNLAFAPGAIVGAVMAGVLRDLAGDDVALGVVALICIATAFVPAQIALPVKVEVEAAAGRSAIEPGRTV